MNIGQAFPSQYVKAADLQGRDIPAVIRGVVMEEINDMQHGGTSRKPVVYFQNKDRGLVLNVTNANTIAAAYGQETDAWVGRQVVLYPTQTDFAGRMVDAIRIRIPQVTQAQVAATPTAPGPVGAYPQNDPLHPGDGSPDITPSRAIDDDIPF